MSVNITIVKAGPMMSVQDNGRFGYRARGLSTSGAMDRASHSIANALVGNDPQAAAVEFALLGGTFTADADILVAVTGGACQIDIDGRAYSPWESFILRKGKVLNVGALQGAVWGYIAFAGLLDCEPVLGSRSTHLRTALGGLHGKTLAAGDTLSFAAPRDQTPKRLSSLYPRSQAAIRVVLGPQDDYFDQSTINDFLTKPFKATQSRDRMAMVLDGPVLKAAKGHDIVSDATVFGSIQVPGSGRPIVLTADGQTTGGYPKIATVTSCDIARLAQLPAGRSFQFKAISADHAEELALHERQVLSRVLTELVAINCMQMARHKLRHQTFHPTL